MGQRSPLTWIWFDPRRVYRCCVSSNGVSTRQSGRSAFHTPGKCRQRAFRRCACGCGESLGEVRADKEGLWGMISTWCSSLLNALPHSG